MGSGLSGGVCDSLFGYVDDDAAQEVGFGAGVVGGICADELVADGAGAGWAGVCVGTDDGGGVRVVYVFDVARSKDFAANAERKNRVGAFDRGGGWNTAVF